MIEEGATPVGPASEWSKAVLDAAMDAVIMIDERGRVVYWNPAATAMFGWSAHEAHQRDMADMIIPSELQARHRHAFENSELGRQGSILGRRVEVAGRRRDGSTFPVELTITRTDRGGRRQYTGYLRDITEQRETMSQLRASQTRLLEVSDAVRRQVERDLHDGAQQQLVGAAMAVTQARATVATDLARTEELLDRAAQVLVDTIAEIRELARGVLPGVLTDHGLGPALAELGRRSVIPVQIHAVDERWPPLVETTVYFLAAEALTNAAKHGAPAAQISLRDERTTDQSGSERTVAGRTLVCVVVDEGPGGADLREGTGLKGLKDRIAAVGGTFDIDSPRGRGTTLTCRIDVAD